MSKNSSNFVLIKIAVGEEEESYNKLNEIEGISGIHFVYGEFDMVLVIKERDSTKLRDIIMRSIRSVKGVIDTTTLVAAD